MAFPSDPTVFRDRVAPTGALRKSLLEDFTAPSPPYVSEEDYEYFFETFQRGGLTAPTCWYKVMMNQMSAKDDQRTTLNLLLPRDKPDLPSCMQKFLLNAGILLRPHLYSSVWVHSITFARQLWETPSSGSLSSSNTKLRRRSMTGIIGLFCRKLNSSVAIWLCGSRAWLLDLFATLLCYSSKGLPLGTYDSVFAFAVMSFVFSYK